jgi:regulator of replication initiation timing
MAKKSKNSMFTDIMKQAGASTDAAEVSKTATLSTQGEVLESAMEVKYDDVSTKEEEIRKLFKENSDLTDKIAQYIDEVKKLKAECKKLKDELDDSNMKVSQLSFENATLKAKLEEGNVQDASQVSKSMQVPYKSNSRRKNSNGYSDWN